MPVRIPIYQSKLSAPEPAIDGIDYPAVPGIETSAGVLRVPIQEIGMGRIVRVAIMPVGEEPCAYTLHMRDSFGDGWNGAYLTVYVNGASIGDFTVPEAESFFSASFSAPFGAEVILEYTAGDYDSENAYEFRIGQGMVLFADGPEPETGVVFTTNCEGGGVEPRPNDCEWMVPLVGDNWTPDDPDRWQLGTEGDLNYEGGTCADVDFNLYSSADSEAAVSGDFVWVVKITDRTSGLGTSTGGICLTSGTALCAVSWARIVGYTNFAGLRMPDLTSYIDAVDISESIPPDQADVAVYLKLERVSGTVTGYWSMDGASWGLIGSVACDYTQIGVFANRYDYTNFDFRLLSLTPCNPVS